MLVASLVVETEDIDPVVFWLVVEAMFKVMHIHSVLLVLAHADLTTRNADCQRSVWDCPDTRGICDYGFSKTCRSVPASCSPSAADRRDSVVR